MKIWAVVGLVTVLACAPARAQWSVKAGAGGSRHLQIVDAESLSALLELQYDGPQWGYLSTGIPLDSAAPPWVVVGTGRRVERQVGFADFGMEPNLQLHAFHERALGETGAGVTAELIPYVGWTRGTIRFEISSGPRFYLNRFAEDTERRTVLDSSLRATTLSAGGILVGAQMRYVHSGDGSFPFAGLGLEAALGPAIVRTHAGHWFGDLDEAAWGASAAVPVGGRTSIQARYEQEAPDPLFWNAMRRSWGVALHYRIGGARARYRTAPVQPGGAIQIRVPEAEAPDALSIAGDFNEWEPTPMQLLDGVWNHAVQLEPGIYRYAFQRSDGSWFLPESVTPRVDDGFGGENALLIVGDPQQ